MKQVEVKPVTAEDFEIVKDGRYYLTLFCSSQEGEPCKTKAEAQAQIEKLVIEHNEKFKTRPILTFRRMLNPASQRDINLAERNGLYLTPTTPVKELTDSFGFLYYRYAE